MVDRSRRMTLHVLGVVAIPGLSGCYVNIGRDGDRQPRLEFHPEVKPTENAWELEVWVRHTSDNTASIHDVTVVAFNERGEEVCRIHVGDFPQGGRFEETVSVICEEFPAVITATAEETPCDGANIQLVYWTGTDDQRGEEIPDGIFVWGSTFRECGEPLPPERVISNVSTSESTPGGSQQ